jgi:hypothetical protein
MWQSIQKENEIGRPLAKAIEQTTHHAVEVLFCIAASRRVSLSGRDRKLSCAEKQSVPVGRNKPVVIHFICLHMEDLSLADDIDRKTRRRELRNLRGSWFIAHAFFSIARRRLIIFVGIKLVNLLVLFCFSPIGSRGGAERDFASGAGFAYNALSRRGATTSTHFVTDQRTTTDRREFRLSGGASSAIVVPHDAEPRTFSRREAE